MDRLFKDVRFLKGVGPKRGKYLERLGIKSIFDLFWHIPRNYFNRSVLDNIAALQPGVDANIRGIIRATQASYSVQQNMPVFKAIVQSEEATVSAVWFNQRHIANIIKKGQEIFLTGKVKKSYGVLEIHVKEYEILEGKNINFKILPVYSLTEGLSQKFMRNIILNALHNYLIFYPEIIPDFIREKFELCDIRFAFRNVHFPDNRDSYLQARKRLAVEELLLFQFSLKQGQEKPPAANSYIIHRDKTDLVKRIIDGLPFSLTSSQWKVIEEIFFDMESPSNMNRLLQGDVGSGKTIVAALAMAKSVASGYQAALMVPTEILAKQHYQTTSKFFDGSDVLIACLTGGVSSSERRRILEATASGEVNILVGTHSLIQDTVKFANLGLVIIDEQHRFGVKQRAVLSQKGNAPDVLVMTATPIPRTLALTVYGDLDISVIDELPPGRKPVKTILTKKAYRERVYSFIHNEIAKNVQIYVICPLIEESAKHDLQAAISLYKELKNEIFPEFNVGLIHGRLKSAEKEQIMERFKKGDINILVSTSVIEAGVDVANASIMVIEHAERFGLSQLHQLRGRVGRGDRQSYCFLIADSRNKDSFKRLKVMEKSSDGFKLAQVDLLMRGAGEFWGIKQHGLDQLKVADLVRDQEMVQLSRELASRIEVGKISDINKYINAKYKKYPNISRN